MTESRAGYSLELHHADGIGVDFEYLHATSSEEAIELAQLRLLLGPAYLVVSLWCGDKVVATFKRDGR